MGEGLVWWLGGALGPTGELVWTTPPWVIQLLIATALAIWGAGIVGNRPFWRRALESVALGFGLAGMVAALAGPVWVEEDGRPELGRSVVLVDASRSMSTLEEGTPRSSAVAEILAHVRRERGSVDVFHFGDTLRIGEPSTYDLPGTDLAGALDALKERVAGERLASLVLVTDGLDRGLLRRSFASAHSARDGVRPIPMEQFTAVGALGLPGPLTVFQVGSVRDVTDLAVRTIDSGGYAFIRSPFRIVAEIEGVGFANRTVTATLERDGAPLMRRPVTLGADGRAAVTFEVTPDEAGRFTYAVSVPVYEGDAVPANNALPLVVKVVRDRIRVLQVAGSPSWDVKFLRRFLKGDPSVQLVSFFILRTTRDMSSAYGDQELSLIAFPYQRLFDEDLWTFDVVIFQNFDYQPYFAYESPVLLENLKIYVENGGALVMVGGDRSFGLGKYAGTPLSSVLPVEVSETETPDLGQFVATLTDEGSRHPITRLVSDGAENATWWERMHPADGTNVVVRARDDAAVLLSHPTRLSADGTPLPILSVREVGAGRTMALSVDSSWRWSLSEAAEGRGNQAYLRFWKNAIRWLMKDSTVDRVTVDTARENYAVGDEVRVLVRARDPGFAPLVGADVSVEVQSEGRMTRLEGQTDLDGEVSLPFPAEHRGTHRVMAQVAHRGAVIGSTQTVFAVTARDPELDEVAPDEAFLSWLAFATDGVRHGPGELGSIRVDPGAVRMVRERRETVLWRAPALGLWITGWLGMGWIVRRRAGLR